MEGNTDVQSQPDPLRLLAELSPVDRARLLGADFDLNRALANKRAHRRLLEQLSAPERLRTLQELVKATQLQRGLRHAAEGVVIPEPAEPLRFGGRSTAKGVSYEARIASFIAVKMLCGNASALWNGISGADILGITLQAAEPVDDIVVDLKGDDARAFISAKERNQKIPLTAKSAAFADTIEAFVRQFLKLNDQERKLSRLILAIPSAAGLEATRDLPQVLDTLRACDPKLSPQEFASTRSARETKAFQKLVSVAGDVWIKATAQNPQPEELQAFARMVYVQVFDFEQGGRLEREATSDLASNVVADSEQAFRGWETLQHFFVRADATGIPITERSLRRALVDAGITLKGSPDYNKDIARLQELTTRNIARLEEHTSLQFNVGSANAFHIDRSHELTALTTAAASGHLLITGEPGSGKSGLIHSLAVEMERNGTPIVLLLAEEIFGRDWKGAANLPGLEHPLDEVLMHWPSGAQGVLITDALDAVRDVETQKMLRHLLRNVKEGRSRWTVVASVREFDLEYGRELRGMFPGSGVDGFSSKKFQGIAHFHVPRLSEEQLNVLISSHAEIRPFVDGARRSQNSEGIHLSPFYLRLAADLLSHGEKPTRLADWNSPAILLRKFWEARVREGPKSAECEIALKAMCTKMVEVRSMVLSTTELTLGKPEREGINELRSRGILQSPYRSRDTRVGDDGLRFTHHLLHDYAISASLIPTNSERFTDFAISHTLLPIFYRQSFMFGLEELWDVDPEGGRESFWNSALKLESIPTLHGITRILAPVLAARRVEVFDDLQPLITALTGNEEAKLPAQKALLHLAAGIQDVSADAIRAGASGWLRFARALSALLSENETVEWPLVLILARLKALDAEKRLAEREYLNATGRGLLNHHVIQEPSARRRYPAQVAIETVCQSFGTAPVESKRALLALVAPDRLAKFPHNDLYDLAHNLKQLGTEGNEVVLQLFEAAFSIAPKHGEWEESGSAIMSMKFQTSDQWNMIHHGLAEYYESLHGQNAGLLAEAACIAWNAASRRHADNRSSEPLILTTIQFRGATCELVEDYSHIWGRSFEYEENRIISHFEKLLRNWAETNDQARLNEALDHFAIRNRTSLMWAVLLEVAAAHPLTLGKLVEGVLNESVFLSHPDYVFGGTELLGALHKTGDHGQRERLEKLILGLPHTIRTRDGATNEQITRWVTHAQNRLLGVLENSNIALATVRELKAAREASQTLPINRRPEGPQVISRTLSDEELIEERGVNLSQSPNKEMFELRETLKLFLSRDNKKASVEDIESHWSVIGEAEQAIERYATSHHDMSNELWGYLVGACESIAAHAKWERKDPRWETVRRILLTACDDSDPPGDDENDTEEGGMMSWGWPAPRLDAARGLPFLAFRLGIADESVASALRKLCFDKSNALRFNFAERLTLLDKPAPELMWELLETFVAHEQRFVVLMAVVHSLDRLFALEPDRVLTNLGVVATKAAASAPPAHDIHEALVQVHLFHFLRTGNVASGRFISSAIEECDTLRAADALMPQLHNCRAGGWLTIGDAVTPDAEGDEIRNRTWSFFSNLLAAGQTKLHKSQQALLQLGPNVSPDSETASPLLEKRNRVSRLVDAIGVQLYFASGAFDEKTKKDHEALSQAQLTRFWKEGAPLLTALATEIHPHTAYQLVQTLQHLLPCAPEQIFLLAARSIGNSAKVGFQFESLAVGEVVKLVQRVLADYPDLFRPEMGRDSECLAALLDVLDLFVEAGWAEARQLTHRLEEIYR